MWGYTRHNTSCPLYGGHTARIRPSLDGLIRGVTSPSTVPSNYFFKARRDGYGARIMVARIPIYTDTVLSPSGHGCDHAREVRPLCIDMHQRWGVLLVMGTAPAIAGGTASVKSASRAEQATAATPEVLEPRA